MTNLYKTQRRSNMEKKKIYDELEKDVLQSNLSDKDKTQMLKNIMKLKEGKLNILVTGVTGAGKSSTINALFDIEKAKIGTSADPETMDIVRYEMDNLILWDTPGLGDGIENDKRHAKNIIDKLTEVDENNAPLIDIVLVILDGGSRDLGTSYDLINTVLIPHLGENAKERILIAINQCDVAMKGRYWNESENKPEPKLVEFLEEKVKSVQKRIKEDTGVTIEPIYYSAGYKEEGEPQCKPYNLSKLLYYIVKATPSEKRTLFLNQTNPEKEMWEEDDEILDYKTETKKGIWESLMERLEYGIDDIKMYTEVFYNVYLEDAFGKIANKAKDVIEGFGNFLKNWF